MTYRICWLYDVLLRNNVEKTWPNLLICTDFKTEEIKLFTTVHTHIPQFISHMNKLIRGVYFELNRESELDKPALNGFLLADDQRFLYESEETWQKHMTFNTAREKYKMNINLEDRWMV